jgi:hypothetical protein
MNAARRTLVFVLLLILCVSLAAAPAAARNGVGVDITKTALGKGKIKATAASFATQGEAVTEEDLTATKLDDEGILVLRKGYEAEKTVDGYRVTTPRDLASTESTSQAFTAAAARFLDPAWITVLRGSLAGQRAYGYLPQALQDGERR